MGRNMRQNLQVAPQKSLVMTFQMQQALSILQMPQAELAQFLREEIDKNPLLEEISRSKSPTFDRDIPASFSIYDHLEAQIKESFPEKKDERIAKKLLENLDEKGFLSVSLETIDESLPKLEEVLKILQTFDPPGVFAKNLQEGLLIQLRDQGKKNTPAYTLVQDHYLDLLHGRYSLLKKKCSSTDLAQAIEKLSHLQMRPLESLKQETARPITPDIFIRKTDTGWEVGALEDELPQVVLSEQYEGVTPATDDEKKTLQLWGSQGKGLLNSLSRRKEILLQIGAKIVRRQSQYLAQKGPLASLTIEELKQELGLHESTLSRALSGKYAETPRGLLLLKSLITASPKKREAKEVLQQIVREEDKTRPLSDDALTTELEKRGHPVARRTVSKYRKELKISPAKNRKHLQRS